MTIERKVGMGIAGQPTGPAADVAEVFSTYLYDGNGGTKTITSGIDISGEGGLVITKARDIVEGMNWVDTVRGAPNYMRSHVNDVSSALTTGLTAFNSTGHVYGSNSEVNQNTKKYVAWTFRKKEKFFDVVTYSGNSSSQSIAHDLAGPVGMIIIKGINFADDWMVWHKSFPTKNHRFNTNAAYNGDITGGTAPTDTHFTLNNDSAYNQSGRTHVAYVFADNSSEDIDDQMIQCGSFVFGALAADPYQILTLPWEPQFILCKNSTAGGDWILMDTMRGLVTETYGNGVRLRVNSNSVEDSGNLKFRSQKELKMNLPGHGTYLYMAIRGPMMVEPEAATDVFAISQWDGTQWPSGFPVDWFFMRKDAEDSTQVHTRLSGNMEIYSTSSTTVENNDTFGSYRLFDFNDGVWNENVAGGDYAFMFSRAKGFFDVVSYAGNSSATNQPHSLGVAPEMMIIKARDLAMNWVVWHKDIASSSPYYEIVLNLDEAQTDVNNTNAVFSGVPTDTTFPLPSGTASSTNRTGYNYFAYLFATLAGISKVGSYTGNGSSQTINCGFSSGAKFVLIKRANASGDWYMWNTTRGIVAGNDTHYSLNNTDTAITTDDSVDPANSGFIVNQVSATNINVSSSTYIFYAIA